MIVLYGLMDNYNNYDRSRVYAPLINAVTISIFMLSHPIPLSSVYFTMFSEFKQYQSSNISSVKAYGLSTDSAKQIKVFRDRVA
jgi:hypothetical protein